MLVISKNMLISIETIIIIYSIILNTFILSTILWIQKKEDPDVFWFLKYIIKQNLYWLIIPLLIYVFIGNLK